MSSDWYYTHDGATHGPFTEKEIKDCAARRMLLESDWVWEGIGERKYAVPAKVVTQTMEKLREANEMRNDDVTLLLIQPENP